MQQFRWKSVCSWIKPEEDQLLLVLVLPQKRHQAVELVLGPTDLKRRGGEVSAGARPRPLEEVRQVRRAHRVVVGESGRCLLRGGGGHALLFDGDAHRVPETCPHQLLQFLGLRGWKQACAPLLGEVAQDGVQAEETSSAFEKTTHPEIFNWRYDCLSLLTWPQIPSPGVCRPHPVPARPDPGLHRPGPDHQTSSWTCPPSGPGWRSQCLPCKIKSITFFKKWSQMWDAWCWASQPLVALDGIWP